MMQNELDPSEMPTEPRTLYFVAGPLDGQHRLVPGWYEGRIFSVNAALPGTPEEMHYYVCGESNAEYVGTDEPA